MMKFPPISTAIRLATILLAIAAAVTPARAGQVATFGFSGVIDESQADSVEIGTPFSGTFGYDLDAINLYPEPFGGSYEFPLPASAPVGFSYSVGARTFSAADSAYLSILNDFPHFTDDEILVYEDWFVFQGYSPGLEGDLVDGEIGLYGPGSALSSARPPETLSLSAFEFTNFSGSILQRVRNPRGPGTRLVEFSFSGEIQILELVGIQATVPEPSSIALIALGGMSLLALRARAAVGRMRRR